MAQGKDLDVVAAVWRSSGVSRPWNDPASDVAFCRKSPHATLLAGRLAGEVVATTLVGPA